MARHKGTHTDTHSEHNRINERNKRKESNNNEYIFRPDSPLSIRKCINGVNRYIPRFLVVTPRYETLGEGSSEGIDTEGNRSQLAQIKIGWGVENK